MACRILVPWPGIEPMPPTEEAWSLNQWTPREVPSSAFLDSTDKWDYAVFVFDLFHLA